MCKPRSDIVFGDLSIGNLGDRPDAPKGRLPRRAWRGEQGDKKTNLASNMIVVASLMVAVCAANILCRFCIYREFGTNRGGLDKCNAADNDTFEKVELSIYRCAMHNRASYGAGSGASD